FTSIFYTLSLHDALPIYFIYFPDTGRTDLVYEKLNQVQHKYLRPGKSIIRTIKEQDCVLHLPYQSFDYIIQLLREATLDPKVKSDRKSTRLNSSHVAISY